MKKKILDGLPKKASFFQRIFINSKGMVYLFISDPGNNSNQAIDIFSNDGKYLYSTKIKMEEGFSIRNIEFNNNSVVISYEDEEGEIKVAKFQIVQPTL